MKYRRQVGICRIYFNNLWAYEKDGENKVYIVEFEVMGFKNYKYFAYEHLAINFANKWTLNNRECERLFICK